MVTFVGEILTEREHKGSYLIWFAVSWLEWLLVGRRPMHGEVAGSIPGRAHAQIVG